MYSEHGLRRVDPPDGRAGVPFVDGGVELHARVGARPGGVGDLVPQVARACSVLATLPSVRQMSCQSPSSITRSMNSSVTRTELFEFCPETVW